MFIYLLETYIHTKADRAHEGTNHEGQSFAQVVALVYVITIKVHHFGLIGERSHSDHVAERLLSCAAGMG